MDSFHFRNIKVEKANKAMHKHRRLPKVTTLFRVIEICVFLIILSRSSSTLLPNFTWKFSGEYFQGIFTSLVSPRFVFIVGNVIVVILFMKSRQSTTAQEGNNFTNNKADFYDEYVKSCQRTPPQTVLAAESHKESKEMIICDQPREVIDKKKKRSMHRSQSENLIKNMHNNQDRPLRRSVTERCLESVENCGMKSIKSDPVDEMSNEEFKSRVEAFIARQQRLLREE